MTGATGWCVQMALANCRRSGIVDVVALESLSSLLSSLWNRCCCEKEMSRRRQGSRRLADERQPLYDTLVMYHSRQRIRGIGYTKGDDVNGRR